MHNLISETPGSWFDPELGLGLVSTSQQVRACCMDMLTSYLHVSCGDTRGQCHMYKSIITGNGQQTKNNNKKKHLEWKTKSSMFHHRNNGWKMVLRKVKEKKMMVQKKSCLNHSRQNPFSLKISEGFFCNE